MSSDESSQEPPQSPSIDGDDAAVAGSQAASKRSPIKVIGGHVETGQSWVNHFQARHFIIAFPFAVFRKYSDDKASRLAALLTYYGFVSIFPILLLLVEVLHMVLRNNPTLTQQIIDTIIPEPLRDSVQQSMNNFPTGGWPLAIGVISLLLAGLGGAFAAYAAVTQIMQIPYRKWYGFGPRYIRVILTLLLVIFGTIGLGTLIVLSANAKVPVLSTPGWSYLITGGFLWVVLFTGIHLLSPRRVPFREVWIGCLLGAAGILVIIYLGGQILQVLVDQRSAVYGVFASFIALLALVFLLAQVVVISAEVSTVWAYRLWPRSIDIMVYFDADERAMKLLANMEERMPRERVTVHFVEDAKDDPDPWLESARTRGTGDYGRDTSDTRDSGDDTSAQNPESGSES